MPILTMVDLMGIQDFVFASNKLTEVDGGSTLVRELVSGDDNRVLLAEGGSMLLCFDDLKDEEKDFAGCFSRRLLEQAPTLQAAITHLEYTSGRLAEAVRDILVQVQKDKRRRLPGAPLLNLGVAEVCRETGLPAVTFDKYHRPISRDVEVRMAAAGRTISTWRGYLPDVPAQIRAGPATKLEFPLDIDRMGRSRGDTSMVGIIHIDGNGMGQRITEWLNQCIEANMGDEEFRRQYQALGKAINEKVNTVIGKMLRRVVDAVIWDERAQKYLIQGQPGGFCLDHDRDALYLPLRPVITGGDDVTFLCDGRIALDLAAFALQEFRQPPEVPGLGLLSACAGVHIVHSHTPLIRAYRLAESLCASAKKRVRGLQQESLLNMASYDSALDWHVSYGSTTEPLDRLRRREYKRDGHMLTLRPYLLGTSRESPPSPGTWYWLAEQLLGNQGFQGDFWLEHRSKVKRLREMARLGPEQVRAAVQAWRVPMLGLQLPGKLPDDGFLAQVPGMKEKGTPLLDAIELVDLHLSLPQERGCVGDDKAAENCVAGRSLG